MTLYEAVIDNFDFRQLLAIKDKLAHLDQRLEDIFPKSQFNVFLKPHDDEKGTKEIDICVAIDGEVTASQLLRLEREVEVTIGRKHNTRPSRRPRIVERFVNL